MMKPSLIIAELSAAAGVDAPAVDVFENKNPLAYTDVLSDKIHISSGMVDTVTSAELRAVMSHELGHLVKQHPLQVIILRIAMVGLAVYLGYLEVFGWYGLVVMAMVIVAMDNIFTALCEMRADDFAADNCGDPLCMVSYLFCSMGRRHRRLQRLWFLFRPVGFPLTMHRIRRLLRRCDRENILKG
jgi:Zn-dependent protease with chaperone function